MERTVKAQVRLSNTVALLVIRAWREDEQGPSIRARIVEIPDLEAPQERVLTTSRREEVHAIVDRWLDSLCGT